MSAVKKTDDQLGNVTPFVRERAGENVIFGARLRSRIAKEKGDAFGDLDCRDSDGAGRHLLPASQALVGVGGELVPAETKLRDTVQMPDAVTADASLDRLKQLEWAGALEAGLDVADTIEAEDSLEKMLAHQMAVLHKLTMSMASRYQDMQHTYSEFSAQQRNVEQCRVVTTIARLSSAFQQGIVALKQKRSGGSQRVHIYHHNQNVQVNEGGKAVVAGKVKGGGRVQKGKGGAVRK
jgi:hypothetical protein